MAKILLVSAATALVVIFVLMGIQILIIWGATGKVRYDSRPFTRTLVHPDSKFLFMGDSTAVGTGAENNTQSVAGWFGMDFPNASIDNLSANGKKLNELDLEMVGLKGSTYDLVVIQIGANDIMKFSSLKSCEGYITHIIEQAQAMSEHVVILHSGNVGLAPVFVWPFDQIFAARSRAMRALYKAKAKEKGALYVDLYTERSNDIFLKDIPKYYSLDHLHPSGQGYQWWYQRIRQTLNDAGVVL